MWASDALIRGSLGYFPGHIHAFWLIYKKMQAEERYGVGGFMCMFHSFYHAALCLLMSAQMLGTVCISLYTKFRDRIMELLERNIMACILVLFSFSLYTFFSWNGPLISITEYML